MSKKIETIEREIARCIVLAQISSDAGKGIYELEIRGSDKASYLGYTAKPEYINRALHLIGSVPTCAFKFWSEKAPDQNGYGSTCTYFLFRGEGKRLQVSFHSPAREKVPHGGMPMRWDHKKSREACKELIGIFDL